MSSESDEITFVNNTAQRRYEAHLDGEVVGLAAYQLTHELIIFTHTEVDPQLEGRGIGGRMARFALDDVKAAGTHKVVPFCPFIRAWINKHPDYAGLVYDRPAPTFG